MLEDEEEECTEGNEEIKIHGLEPALYRISGTFLESQPYVKWEHRIVVVDWMMEITTEIGFKRETFHLAVHYLDRFLMKAPPIERRLVQLVAAAAV